MEHPELSEKEIQELSELIQYNRMGVLSYFWEISKEHHVKHEDYSKSANLIFKNNADLQSEEYYDLGNKSQKSAYISIVFAAMFIEGSIYDFGCIYLGDKYVKENLDKLNPLSKISVILKLVTKKDLESNGQAYEHLKRLFRYRNKLVHTKTKPTNYDEESLKQREKEKTEYSLAIESAKYAVEFLDRETREINTDKYHPGIFGHF